MPREVIRKPYHTVHTTKDATHVVNPAEVDPNAPLPAGVSVIFNAGLEIEWHDGRAPSVVIRANRRAFELAASRAERDGETEAYMHVDVLFRDEINQTVRALRRARNAAFGGDE